MSETLPSGIRATTEAMRSGRLTAVDVATACLDVADRLAEDLNVFAARAERSKLLAEAAEIDRRRRAGEDLGLLAGIPIGIKDIFFTRDFPTTASSKVFSGHQTGEDGVAVARLRAAGALFVGKTHTHEFAFGPTTANEYAGVSRNPWNVEHVPGGSSGGSAIAVSTGMCFGATASDTGGSIRHPSSFCGVTGLKPTYGRVSRRGIFPLAWSLDHAGPIARTADDVAFLLQVMAGYDPEDPGSIDKPVPDYVGGIDDPPASLRIGIPREHYFDILDPDVRAAFDASIEVLKSFGWRVEPISLPRIRYALGAELAILSAEAACFHRHTMRKRAEDVSPNVRRELDAGATVLATDYLLGQRVRRLIAEDFAEALSKVDVLATPTTPIPAPRIGQMTVEIGGGILFGAGCDLAERLSDQPHRLARPVPAMRLLVRRPAAEPPAHRATLRRAAALEGRRPVSAGDRLAHTSAAGAAVAGSRGLRDDGSTSASSIVALPRPRGRSAARPCPEAHPPPRIPSHPVERFSVRARPATRAACCADRVLANGEATKRRKQREKQDDNVDNEKKLSVYPVGQVWRLRTGSDGDSGLACGAGMGRGGVQSGCTAA